MSNFHSESLLAKPPLDSGYPIGYWAFVRDPDGHILELSHGQEVGPDAALASAAANASNTPRPA